jgi:hypothetical protein
MDTKPMATGATHIPETATLPRLTVTTHPPLANSPVVKRAKLKPKNQLLLRAAVSRNGSLLRAASRLRVR